MGQAIQLQGELRVTHLTAHLEMKKILSPQQVAKYDELRGYGKDKQVEHPHGKH
jgi:Spy/CpxP family protein refolding chaperone